MSKTDRDDLFKVLDPKVPFEVEHTQSKERRLLLADSRYKNLIRSAWKGSFGYVEFDVKTGQGKGESPGYSRIDASSWRITFESLKSINGPEFEPRPAPARKARELKPKPLKVDPRQVDMFGEGGGK